MTNAKEADWVLRTMAAMAGADGRLDAREVRLVQQVYEDQTGLTVDMSGVVTAVHIYATKRDVVEELSAAAGSMSLETRQAVIRGAYLTLAANEHISEGERDKLEAIAAALRVTDSQLHEILAPLRDRSPPLKGTA